MRSKGFFRAAPLDMTGLVALTAAVAGCITVVKPTQNQTLSSPVDLQVDWNVEMQAGTFTVLLDATDITSQFTINCVPGQTGCSATANLPIAGGAHTLTASGNLWYFYAQRYEPASDQRSFSVAVPPGPSFSLSPPSPIVIEQGSTATLA